MAFLTPGALIPYFRLPTSRGGALGPWDFKQLRNLVVLFHHGLGCEDCQALLAEVARRYPEIAAQQAEVLALSPDPAPELARAADSGALPFPLLSDRGAAVLRAYVPGGAPSLPRAFVADRYGALGLEVPGPGHELDLGAVIEELAFIECQCPECSLEPDE